MARVLDSPELGVMSASRVASAQNRQLPVGRATMVNPQNRDESFTIVPSKLLDESDASDEVACAARAQE